MPRPVTDLDAYRLQVELWLASGNTYPQVADLLKETFDVDISDRTLRRRLAEWGIRSQIKRDKSEEVDKKLRARIEELYADSTVKDDMALPILNGEGFVLSISQLARLRREMDLLKRVPTASQPANHADILRERKRLRRMKQRRLKKGLPWPPVEGIPPPVSSADTPELVEQDHVDSADMIDSPTPPASTPEEEHVTVPLSYLRELERKAAILDAQPSTLQNGAGAASQYPVRSTRPSNARHIPGLLRGHTFQPSLTTQTSAPTHYPSHHPSLDPSLGYSSYPT